MSGHSALDTSRSLLPPGKLPGNELDRLIDTYRTRNSNGVTVSPGYGRDAAAIDVTETHTIIVKSDPITFTTDDAASLLIAVNANDIACLGGIPRWLSVVALFADRTTDLPAVERIFADLKRACDSANIALIGGHTEITMGLPRTLLMGTMIGVAGPRGIIEPGGGQPADDIWMTRSMGIEGTAILAHARRPKLTALFGSELVQQALSLLDDPGLLIARDAERLLDVEGVVALHDPTEGGVATAVHELAAASGCGAEVHSFRIPILDTTRAFCEHFNLDPRGLLGSGALLVVAHRSSREHLDLLAASGELTLARIGRLTDAASGVVDVGTDGSVRALPRFDSDEISRVL